VLKDSNINVKTLNTPMGFIYHQLIRKPMLYPTELRAQFYLSDGLLYLLTLIQTFF